MQTIKASEFKEKCLQIMNEVNETGDEVIITKNGKPVSKLVPFKIPVSSLFGQHKHQIKSKDSLIESVNETWNA